MRDAYVWIDPFEEIEWWQEETYRLRTQRDERLHELRESHYHETICLKNMNEHLLKKICEIAALQNVPPIFIKDPKANDRD